MAAYLYTIDITCQHLLNLFLFFYLSQTLITTHMEFEKLEEEASAIHGDLWEQLNTGGLVEYNTVIISVVIDIFA